MRGKSRLQGGKRTNKSQRLVGRRKGRQRSVARGKTHQQVPMTRWSSQMLEEVGCGGKMHQRVIETRWSSQRAAEVGCEGERSVARGKTDQRVIETRWLSQRPAEVGCEGENALTSHRDLLVVVEVGRDPF